MNERSLPAHLPAVGCVFTGDMTAFRHGSKLEGNRAEKQSYFRRSTGYSGSVDTPARSLYSSLASRLEGLDAHASNWMGASIGALLSAVYGVADAQTSKPNADTSAGMQRQVNLSPQEQLDQADAFVARMDVTGGSVRRMLETARAQRDVVKTLCLNDKLNQIDVAMRSAQDRRGALEKRRFAKTRISRATSSRSSQCFVSESNSSVRKPISASVKRRGSSVRPKSRPPSIPTYRPKIPPLTRRIRSSASLR